MTSNQLLTLCRKGNILLAFYFALISFNYQKECEVRFHNLSLFDLQNENQQYLILTLKLLLIFSGSYWYLKENSKLASYLTSISFLLLSSIFINQTFYTPHQSHIISNILILLSLGQTLSSNFQLMSCRIYICITYFLSGMTKIQESGLNWVDGSTLQTWIALTSRESFKSSFLYDFLINNDLCCSILQIITLVGEIFLSLSFLNPILSIVFGLILTGFHIGTEIIFGFGFYGNIFNDFLLFVLSKKTPTTTVIR